jgi:hypothetical protein
MAFMGYTAANTLVGADEVSATFVKEKDKL